ncbi:hypothetical protein BCR43DRAFT_491752 [Syncephalastrum racemosum]|uniref:Uncharacterized protein n=1 Tax=Syncephalastrum racemosum TaxID=13706 RepID=A0A1X2HDQ8_SYNRA|nr:hypothetical protein BCR43DRAFT_491752 [Syncephalastrum racemosum]
MNRRNLSSASQNPSSRPIANAPMNTDHETLTTVTVLYMGIESESCQSVVLQKLSEGIAFLNPRQEPSREARHVVIAQDPIWTAQDTGLAIVDANFCGQPHWMVREYVDATDTIDVVFYFYNEHAPKNQTVRDLVFISQLNSIPAWTVLVPTQNQQQDIHTVQATITGLLRHYCVPCVTLVEHFDDLIDHKHTFGPVTPAEIMTAEQLSKIRRSSMAQILERARRDRRRRLLQKEQRERQNLQQQRKAAKRWPLEVWLMVSILLLAVVATLVKVIYPIRRVDRPAAEDVDPVLDPLWRIPDDFSLQHTVLVELLPRSILVRGDQWNKERIEVRFKGRPGVYEMLHVPGTLGQYSVNLPSPCVLGMDRDLLASIVWHTRDNDRVIVANKLRLSIDRCEEALGDQDLQCPLTSSSSSFS